MYNSIQIIILVLLLFGSIIGIAFVFFTRQTKNFFISILGKYKKRYVVCHMKYQAGLGEDYLVIPNLQGLTQVGKYSYELIDKYVAFRSKGRKHFILQENDSIPKNYDAISDDQIIFQAAEIQTALNNTVMEYLFSKRKELLLMIAFGVAIAGIIVICYNIYELQKMSEIIQSIPRTAS